MLRVALHGPNPIEPIELAEGESVLFGRRPSIEAGDDGARTRTVDAPSVSARHARVAHRGTGAEVTDLGSRNGTWLRLPPHVPVQIGNTDAVSLVFALEPEARTADAPPSDATWTSGADFASGVAKEVDVWFARRGIAAYARVVARDPMSLERVGRMPLPTGEDLRIESSRTLEADFMDVLLEAERYVARQSHLFSSEEELRASGMIVASAGMRRALGRVIDAAEQGVKSLLLTGPSGAGKDGLARAFHAHTKRPGPFVARNCALMSKELVRSELFGAERGAFSGAVARITGAVEAAQHGTLFLDELAELPRDVQPMLLSFLDRGEYERMGRYGKPSTADVRIVCATNSDLRTRALRDEFRLDLWYRLAVCVVEVPPLRERFADVAAYLRTRPTADGATLWDALTDGAIEVLEGHAWEGNFRELSNFAMRVTPLARGRSLDAARCRAALAEGAIGTVESSPRGESSRPPVSEDAMQRIFAVATRAFEEDHRGPVPETWDDVKDFVENYLKPVMLAHLVSAEDATHAGQVDLRAASQRLRADRGTAARQLERYFDRFASTRG